MGFQHDDGSFGMWVRGIAERAPATGLVVAAAGAVSIFWWMGADITWAFENSRAVHGEPWRFLASALPHVNLLHLLFNGWGMLVFGTTLEPYYGWWRTLLLYAVLAAGSGAAEYAAHTGGVGLSGVAYGAMAYLWLAHRRDPWLPFAISQDVIIWFGIWAVACIVFTGTGFMPIANVAHAGGALLGAALALAATAGGWARVGWWGVVAAMYVAVGLGVTTLRPWVNRGPEAAFLHEVAGCERLAAEDWAGALAHFEAARGRGSKEPSVWHNRGFALEKLGRQVEAFAAYRAAFRRAPGLRVARDGMQSLARTLLPPAQAQRRHADVEQYAAALTEADLTDRAAWFAWGSALAAQGKSADARTVFEKGLALHPDYAAMRDALAALPAGAK